MTKELRSIQFIGTQRSGSNLLRVMLNQLPEISAPHPPHILQTFMPLLPMYGNLESPGAFAQLVDDVCTLVELNPVNWGLQFDRAEIASRCAGKNLPQVSKAVYEMKALQKGASWWCCKSMANIHYIDAIEAAGIHPFYIHIYRDGRDVALSFRKAIVGEKHMYALARQWSEEQELSHALCAKLDPSRSIQIRYEEYTLDPEKTIRAICEKTGVMYRPEVMDYNRSDESKETAASGLMWGNLVKPVMKDNTNKFLRELSAEDIAIFESVAGETLQKLGYTLHAGKDTRTNFSETEIAVFHAENKKGKEEARKKADPADLEKRAAQDAFIGALKKRFESVTANA
ncbi:MAG: sulfotransferase [Bacteroidetes bacterium]|nr:MAG: sulfotransferase [Bacteroidota bacterium]